MATYNTMADIARGFETEQLQSNNPADVKIQFSLEGKKRIPSLIIDKYFIENLRCPELSDSGIRFCFGWHFCYNNDRTIAIRLSSPGKDWNGCDKIFAGILDKKHIPVIRATWENNSIMGARWQSGAFLETVPINQVLLNIAGRNKTIPLQHKYTKDTQFDRNWTELSSGLSPKHLELLSMQRRLMNIHIPMCMGSQGCDIDALAILPGDEIVVVELKRKYPSTRKRHLGLDIIPHVKNMRLFWSLGLRTLHLWLVNPRVWKSDVDPIALLQDKTLVNNWIWCAKWLEETHLGAVTMHTKGENNGMTVGQEDRYQKSINWPVYFIANTVHWTGAGAMIHILSGNYDAVEPLDYESLRVRANVRIPR